MLQHASNHDLLAALVGKSAALKMLGDSGNSLNHILREAERPYLINNANQVIDPLAAALEVVRRAMLEQAKERTYLTSPQDVRNYLRVRMRNLDHEEFYVVYLDSQHGVIGVESLFRGTINQASVHPRELVKQVMAYNASAVILAHNHPSGRAEPSEADRRLTDTLKAALALVDVRVLDHFIVADHTVVSFAEKGIL